MPTQVKSTNRLDCSAASFAFSIHFYTASNRRAFATQCQQQHVRASVVCLCANGYWMTFESIKCERGSSPTARHSYVMRKKISIRLLYKFSHLISLDKYILFSASFSFSRLWCVPCSTWSRDRMSVVVNTDMAPRYNSFFD